MKIDRNHPIAQHVLSLLRCHGWTLASVNHLCLHHPEGYSLTVDTNWDGILRRAEVRVQTSHGHFKIPLLTHKKLFGLYYVVDESDPYVQWYKRTLAECQEEHIRTLLSESKS